jgi:hypothetical protein
MADYMEFIIGLSENFPHSTVKSFKYGQVGSIFPDRDDSHRADRLEQRR